MKSKSFLSDEVLAETAFNLLTSSGIVRYVRMSAKAAKRADLLSKSGKTGDDILWRMIALCKKLKRKTTRQMEEVELAVLISTIGLHPRLSSYCRWIFVDISKMKGPAMLWPVALARHFLNVNVE